MRSRRFTHLLSLLSVPVLAAALVACSEDVEEDPRGSLREAVVSLGDWEGFEVTVGADADETAQAAILDEGDLDDDELAMMLDSSLTARTVQAEDDDGQDQSESEFLLTVAGEQVLALRTLPGYELYVLIDLEASERVAEALDEQAAFAGAVDEIEEMAGAFGLEDVVAAAREGEWIRVSGGEQLASMVSGMAADTGVEEPDQDELEELGRRVGQQMLDFLDDDGVSIGHVGEDDAGERVRVSAGGAPLRDLVSDLLTEVEQVTGSDPMGMDVEDLQRELENEIPDDVELTIDAWIDGGELSRIAIDLFEIARASGEDDVPDGELLLALGLADFTGGIEAPDTDASFDLFGLMGAFMGGMGPGDDPLAEDPGEVPDEDLQEEMPEQEMDEEMPDDLADEDFCFTEEEIEEELERLPEDQRELAEQEIESGAVPIC